MVKNVESERKNRHGDWIIKPEKCFYFDLNASCVSIGIKVGVIKEFATYRR